MKMQGAEIPAMNIIFMLELVNCFCQRWKCKQQNKQNRGDIFEYAFH